MPDTSTVAPMEPLGVGTILSDSFSILFSNFFKVLILGFVAAFIEFLAISAIVGLPVAIGGIEPEFGTDPTTMFTTFAISMVLMSLVSIVVYGVMSALMIQLAHDAKLGKTASISDQIAAATSAAIPVVVLSIIVGVLSMIGALALIVGAFWVYAVFYIVVPCVVIERTGLDSLGRSAYLTKDYRWPIVGLSILLFVILIVTQLVVEGLLGGFLYLGDDPFGSLTGESFNIFALAYGSITALFNGLQYGLSGIAIALVYLRLRQIKEGVTLDEVAEIFE